MDNPPISVLLYGFLVSVLFFGASCSSTIGSRRSFEKARWAAAQDGTCKPANLNEMEVRPLKDPVFSYGKVSFRRVGVKGGPVYEIGDGASVSYEGKTYNLRALRVVAPSEHRILGMAFLLELQFYHIAADGEPLAIGVFVHKGAERPALRTLFSESSGDLDFGRLLSSYTGHYVYQGIVPDGSCLGVRWVIMKSAIEASADDVDEYLNRWRMVPRETITLPANRVSESE